MSDSNANGCSRCGYSGPGTYFHGDAPLCRRCEIAEAAAEALRAAAISEWDRGDGDGPVIEVHVSQIAPVIVKALGDAGVTP